MWLPVLATVIALLVAAPAQAGLPIIDYSLQGTAGDSGWYVSDVTIVWNVNWNGSTPVSSTCPFAQVVQTDTTPAGTAQSCSATNSAGTSTVSTTALRIDRTKPTATAASPLRPTDSNGWFNAPVPIAWTGSDAASGIAACSTLTYAGPDSASATAGGTCRDVAGNVSEPLAMAFKYDATPPTVTGASADRPPDANGWYMSPVSMAFTATDATSGVDSCNTVPYGGPDSMAANVTGACRDKAGNTGVGSAVVAYDATPPPLSSVSAAPGDTVATVTWKTTEDTKRVSIMRTPGPSTPVFEGNANQFGDRSLRNGVTYTYTVTAIDAPGHRTAKTVKAKPTAWLLTPSPGARRAAPPWLRWKLVKNASYYNIQLYRGKRKILSAWPRNPRLKLQSAWRYNGYWHRLSPDTYRWYVWPGYGDRKLQRYGRLRGARSFTMI